MNDLGLRFGWPDLPAAEPRLVRSRPDSLGFRGLPRLWTGLTGLARMRRGRHHGCLLNRRPCCGRIARDLTGRNLSSRPARTR
jgi:hypothetical protein